MTMKTIRFSIVAALLLSAHTALYAQNTPDVKVNHSEGTTIHSYYDFYALPGKVSADAQKFYELMKIKDHKNIHAALKKQYQKLGETPKEIFKGLSLSMDALVALEENNTAVAEEALSGASDSFEKAFKADPGLKMVPVDIRIKIESDDVTNKDLKKITKDAIEMLKENRLQEADILLLQLKDQVNITTLYLPISFYESGTKSALQHLIKGDKRGALEALYSGFNSMVVQESILPLSLLESHAAILAAADIDKNDKQAAAKLLDTAQEKLEKARLLGYASKYGKAYKDLSAQIKDLRKALKGKNEVEKLYQDLKHDYNLLLDKIVGEIPLIGA